MFTEYLLVPAEKTKKSRRRLDKYTPSRESRGTLAHDARALRGSPFPAGQSAPPLPDCARALRLSFESARGDAAPACLTPLLPTSASLALALALALALCSRSRSCSRSASVILTTI